MTGLSTPVAYPTVTVTVTVTATATAHGPRPTVPGTWAQYICMFTKNGGIFPKDHLVEVVYLG